MINKNNISALSYLSVLFMPILIPIIIYFMDKDESVRYHSKRALLSHLLPTVFALILFIILAILNYFTVISPTIFLLGLIILLVLYGIVMLAITVWNIFQVIKLMRNV